MEILEFMGSKSVFYQKTKVLIERKLSDLFVGVYRPLQRSDSPVNVKYLKYLMVTLFYLMAEP